MHAWPDELRLIATLLANALVLAASWRVARRFNPRAVVALPDALLLWLATQYVVTGVSGLLGALRPDVFLGVASAASLAVLLGVRKVVDARRSEDRVVWIALAFVLAYAGAFLWNQRLVPELATDPLVYHLPAAARWLQDGRIGVVDFWYWLPANSYSPLGGSIWIAWWLAPVGNDALARYVQLPAWLLLFAASLRLLRDLRVPTIVAALSAIAVVVARPFVSQLIIAKDDIAVAALAVTLLGAMHPRRLREPLAPVRLGVALGLLMSVKYVAALAVPALVPAIVLMRWRTLGPRRAIAAAMLAIAFVAPWLVRNAIAAGTPAWPFFSGDGGFVADPDLRTLAGVTRMLAGGFHSLPPAMWTLAIIAAIVAIARRRQSIARDNVFASLLVGPPLALAVLVAFTPFPEVRYLFTAVAMALLLVGIACGSIHDRRVGVALAVGFLVVSIATSFDASWLSLVAGFAVYGAIAAAAVAILTLVAATMRRAIVAIAGLLLLGWIYLDWHAFLRHPDAGYAVGTDNGYAARYGDVGAMWTTLRAHVPAGSTIAYVNTPTIWPLFGFDLHNRVVHAPVRPRVTHLFDLPPIRERVAARDEYVVNTRLQTDGADAATWLANLDRLRVDYVFAAKFDASRDAPEFGFVREHADRFEPMAENAAAIVWRVRRSPVPSAP